MSVRCGMQAERARRLTAEADLAEADQGARNQHTTIQGLRDQVDRTRVEMERASVVLTDTKTELDQALQNLQVWLSIL